MQTTVTDTCVKFQQGINRLEIYAGKTVWQEDAVEVGRFVNGNHVELDQPIPCAEEQGAALKPDTCHCGAAWQPSPGCWCLTNDQVWVHLQADHIGVYGDWEGDAPLLFEMVDPSQMSAAKAKVSELLGLPAVEHLLSSEQVEARQKYFQEMRAQNCITFTLLQTL